VELGKKKGNFKPYILHQNEKKRGGGGKSALSRRKRRRESQKQEKVQVGAWHLVVIGKGLEKKEKRSHRRALQTEPAGRWKKRTATLDKAHDTVSVVPFSKRTVRENKEGGRTWEKNERRYQFYAEGKITI